MVTQEIVGYRGYGRSSGNPGEDGLDAEAAWRYLTETRGEWPDRIVLFGRSLGGAVAIELARRHNPAALVVESTFTNLVEVGRH
ncbi:MAG: alpha/beta hydrolase, partial [Planctomycetes bacterium]|nr:alpha/beta hydrolase [Planctomycetota bacterium]